jgi:hypothetical protein
LATLPSISRPRTTLCASDSATPDILGHPKIPWRTPSRRGGPRTRWSHVSMRRSAFAPGLSSGSDSSTPPRS